MAEGPGRSCPVSYRYGARALAAPASLKADTLWVAGGLYGNVEALERLLELYQDEPGETALVFNGDFHWFNVAIEDFLLVNDAVLRNRAIRGNVETELACPEADAGCGCAYPDWVGDGEVEHSNRIIERLRRTAHTAPGALRPLQALPMHLAAEVAGERVAIVHGDADSLAGWDFSQEVLASRHGKAAALKSFEAANARVIASSHTCLPILQTFQNGNLIVNNGAAGMPNFRGTRHGLVTRISTRPDRRALYAARAGRLHVEAHAVEYDHAAWLKRFLGLWPAGSDAYQSYYRRMIYGPDYELPLARRAA